MFTGIVETIGKLQAVMDGGAHRRFTIHCPAIANSLKCGDSVATDGLCLTVLTADDKQFTAQAVKQTLLVTTAGEWVVGRSLNLERAMPADGRFNGHFVAGHVDCTGKVLSRTGNHGQLYLKISYPPEYARYLIDKGSITVNGVSLTIATLSEQDFSISMIGHTEQYSNLGTLDNGQRVNLEFDLLGKYVLNATRFSKNGKISQSWLADNGF